MTSHEKAALLLEQIRRDTKVLQEDPVYHVPSTAFYMRRVREFKAEYRRLTSGKSSSNR